MSSNYESLQAQLERRFSHGFSLLAAYTYGHSIDNGSSQVDSGAASPQNALNFAAERGNSNFDVRNRLVVSSVYELPFGKGKAFLNQSRIGNAIAGDGSLPAFFRRSPAFRLHRC